MCTVAESNFVPKKTNNKSSQMSTNSMRSSIQIISLARTSVLGSATDTINFFNIFFMIGLWLPTTGARQGPSDWIITNRSQFEGCRALQNLSLLSRSKRLRRLFFAATLLLQLACRADKNVSVLLWQNELCFQNYPRFGYNFQYFNGIYWFRNYCAQFTWLTVTMFVKWTVHNKWIISKSVTFFFILFCFLVVLAVWKII